VVVTETDPPFLCLLGSLLKRTRGCRHVCYLQDIYPDVAVALGKLRDGAKTRLLRRMFFRSYRRSDAVIVLSRDMRALIVEDGVPAERVHVVPNWVDVDAVYPVKQNNRFRHVHGLEDKFIVMYSGNMGLSQRLDQVLEAAELLCDREDVVFAFVGDGADRRNLERQAAERNLANVRFYDYQPKAELADSLSAADVHLVILRPEIKRLLMPSKLYGVLASGTSALVVADEDCELAASVRDNDLGDVVRPDDAAALAAAIRTAAAAPATNARRGADARRYAEAHCTRGASVAGMYSLLASVAGVPRLARQAVDAGYTVRTAGQASSGTRN
jgi:glycosyltransferase involved in cell wall biosynthesis